VVEESETAKLGGTLTYVTEFYLAYLKGNTAGIERVIEKTKDAAYAPIMVMLKARARRRREK
jgi:hypothetical protein